jgi:hypothetical protein
MTAIGSNSMTEADQVELERAAQAFADAFWPFATNLEPYYTMLRIRSLQDPVGRRLALPEKAGES